MGTLSRALCLIVVLMVAASAYGQCNATNIYQTYQELSECLRNAPLDGAVKNQTLATLTSIVPSYVFVDAVKSSPDPTNIPMSVDIMGELEQIAATEYSSDEAFHQALASLFTELQDAHTRYTKPLSPYCAAAFALPYHFYSRVSGGVQNLFISLDEDLLVHYEEVYSVTVDRSVDNYMVVTINGEDPLSVIGQFANVSFFVSSCFFFTDQKLF